MEINTFLILFLFFVLTIFLLKRFNILIDNTSYSEHKKIGKENKNPLVIGGIYLILAILLFLPEKFFYVKIFSTLIFFLGILSDRNYLTNPKLRLFLQLIILFFLAYSENLIIRSISINFFDNLLEINLFNIIFTVFCLSILLNGSNFIDGLNGLVSGYYILVLSSLLFLIYYFNPSIEIANEEINLIKILICSLLIFFIFNLLGFVYLGDGGTYLISTVVAIILLKIYSDNMNISPYYVAALLWYPAFENLFSQIRRLYKNTSISIADRHHLHQLIFRYFSIKKILDKKYINTFTSILILIFNIPTFLLSTIYFYHTKILIGLILLNVFIYLMVYLFLSKNFIPKK